LHSPASSLISSLIPGWAGINVEEDKLYFVVISKNPEGLKPSGFIFGSFI